MTHPLDHQVRFSNIPEEVTPEEARRRFLERLAEIARQLADPERYKRQMRSRTIVPPDPERTSAEHPSPGIPAYPTKEIE